VKKLVAATAASLIPAALAATVAGVEVPAPYATCPVTDTYWNVKVEDPYRCLETTTDEGVQKYMKAHAEATEKVLAKIPGRDRILKRIQEIDSEIPANVTGVNRDEKGGLFYQKRLATDNQFKVYYRKGFDGAEKVLVDPEVMMKATGKPHAIGDFANSRDGRYVSYSISAGGAEIGTLHAIDVDTGKEVMPPIDRIRGGGASWLPDGSGFFYSRLAEGWEKRPRAERFLDNTVYLRKLSDPAKDVAVFGPTVFPELRLARSDAAGVAVLLDQPLAVALVYHGVSPYRSMYVTDKAALLAGKPQWRKVIDPSDQVTTIASHKGWAYARTAKDAPRYKVVRFSLPAADYSKAEVIIPSGNEVVTAIAASPEGLYYTRRQGAAKKLFRLAHGASAGSAGDEIRLPFEGNVAISDVDPVLPGAVLSLSGWTRAARHYFLDAGAREPKPLALVPSGKFDVLSGVTAREVKVKSHDGVEVPVSIISRTDIKLDGRNPTQLYGYAAYGIVEEPSLNARNLAWLEQGGVIVMCHARGGGINGDEWHKAGHKEKKFNTWKDGIATAEWLVANGYTTRERLSIYGGSAGAIFVGRAITERPDLFGAAAIGVGNTDQVRSETRANGAGNIPEYGTVKIESEFQALRNNSMYENIKPGTRYPATLYEHGVNDSRVDVWMTLKAATRQAAAQAATDKPVLMRLEYDGGHGVGSTRLQSQARTADRWAFFLWQAGAPEFQPKP
jgi:prolyl oligopeptidase